MSDLPLTGKKIAVLIESDYYENEIHYYQHRFPEEGMELHLLSRLWGQPSLTFTGHEYKAPLEVNRSFEGLGDDEIRGYSAIIVPSGMVADRLRYTEQVDKPPPPPNSSPGHSRSGASSKASSVMVCGLPHRVPISYGAGGSPATTT